MEASCTQIFWLKKDFLLELYFFLALQDNSVLAVTNHPTLTIVVILANVNYLTSIHKIDFAHISFYVVMSCTCFRDTRLAKPAKLVEYVGEVFFHY